MPPEPSRRPLKSRSTAWAAWLAAWLARSGATPNGISAASLVMALGGALAFIAAGRGWIVPWVGWMAAAIAVQLRLICNLLDGMVAIEGGKRSATGAIWNGSGMTRRGCCRCCCGPSRPVRFSPPCADFAVWRFN